jgi:hypothetical protein
VEVEALEVLEALGVMISVQQEVEGEEVSVAPEVIVTEPLEEAVAVALIAATVTMALALQEEATKEAQVAA